MFLGIGFRRVGEWIGMIGREEVCQLAVLAEGVLSCSRMRAPVLGVLFFAVTSVTADGAENTSLLQKRRVVLLKTTCRFMEGDVSFYRKPRVVLWKVTCCFTENNVLFCRKHRVVL